MATAQMPPALPPIDPWEITRRGWDLVRVETQVLDPTSYIVEWPLPFAGDPGAYLLGWWNTAMRFHFTLQSILARELVPARTGAPVPVTEARALVRATIEAFRPGCRFIPQPLPVRPRSLEVEMATYQIVAGRLLGGLNALLAEYQARFGGFYL